MGQDVLIFAILTTGAVLIIAHLSRLYRTSVQHKTIREALIRNSDSVPALLAGTEEPQPGTANDDRTGMVLIALALAMMGFALIQGDADDIRNLGGSSLFPLFIGAALLIRHRLMRGREHRG